MAFFIILSFLHRTGVMKTFLVKDACQEPLSAQFQVVTHLSIIKYSQLKISVYDFTSVVDPDPGGQK
jgi:hypothetical protein